MIELSCMRKLYQVVLVVFLVGATAFLGIKPAWGRGLAYVDALGYAYCAPPVSYPLTGSTPILYDYSCSELIQACNSALDEFVFCLEGKLFNKQVSGSCSKETVNYRCFQLKPLTQAPGGDGYVAHFDEKIDAYVDCLLDPQFDQGADGKSYVYGGRLNSEPQKFIDGCVSRSGVKLAYSAPPPTNGGAAGESSTADPSDIYDHLGNSVGPLDNYGASAKILCERLPEPAKTNCKACGGKMYTALGCLSTDITTLTVSLVTFLLGVAGLFFLIQILISAFKLVTATGDPRAAQEAKERITSAVIALLFIIFSVTIMRFLGVSVLKIPGFFDVVAK